MRSRSSVRTTLLSRTFVISYLARSYSRANQERRSDQICAIWDSTFLLYHPRVRPPTLRRTSDPVQTHTAHPFVKKNQHMLLAG